MFSNYLTHQPIEDDKSLKFDFPDEDIKVVKDFEIPRPDEGPKPGSRWKLMFNGSSNYMENGVGVIMLNLNGGYTPFTSSLCFDCTNNIVEYEEYILGIEETIDLGIKILEVCGDSTLAIYQVKGKWETCDTKYVLYCDYVMKLIKYFDEITFCHIPRTESQVADALAMLASMYQI
ncbi:uncharacterized protein LOC127096063 [Lathyrus oleraceus]|uniref:uncharacterized protein LOC127096063 n=1 Tax=Pisum sativum TaxID=3888 RepID=UPI0021CE466A|nr:uncharacterized protein LOC127096063 [Pisum sativum]